MKSVRPWGLGFWETWCRRRGVDRPFCLKHRVGWNKGEGNKGQLLIADLHLPVLLDHRGASKLGEVPFCENIFGARKFRILNS